MTPEDLHRAMLARLSEAMLARLEAEVDRQMFALLQPTVSDEDVALDFLRQISQEWKDDRPTRL